MKRLISCAIRPGFVIGILMAGTSVQAEAIYQDELPLSVHHPVHLSLASHGILVCEPQRDRVRMIDDHGNVLRNYLVDCPVAAAEDLDGNVLIAVAGHVDAWRQDGSIAYSLEGAHLTRPLDLAISGDDRIFVADALQHSILVYDADGVYLESYGSEGTGDGQFLFPVAIMLDDTAQEIFVVDQGNSRIQILDMNGNFVRSFGSSPWMDEGEWIFEGTLTRPRGIARDDDDRIYISDLYH